MQDDVGSRWRVPLPYVYNYAVMSTVSRAAAVTRLGWLWDNKAQA